MLIKLQCPSCGAHLEVDQNREFFFCKHCGTKLINIKEEKTLNINQNINQNINVSGTVTYQRDIRNDPNLSVEYTTTLPQYSMELRIDKLYWIVMPGRTEWFRIAPGKHTVKVTINGTSWEKDIYIPFDNTPVQIRFLYSKVAQFLISQPPQGISDYQWILRQEEAKKKAQEEAKRQAKAAKKAAKKRQ